MRTRWKLWTAGLMATVLCASCGERRGDEVIAGDSNKRKTKKMTEKEKKDERAPPKTDDAKKDEKTSAAAAKKAEAKPGLPKVATFGAGCFWCVEAVYQELDGVVAVVSGYAGGTVHNPTYRQVLDGTTGHAEVCQIKYDPKKVSFDELLEVFWKTHDPTTRNRQGNDVGTQYRSAVFYHDDEQRRLAEAYKKKLDAAGIWRRPIVTEITAFQRFYPAEEYHQNYYRLNPQQGYCRAIIAPKMAKFRKVFRSKLKTDGLIAP